MSSRYDENSRSMDRGYPRKTRKDFPGIGPKVDAAFQRNGEDKQSFLDKLTHDRDLKNRITMISPLHTPAHNR